MLTLDQIDDIESFDNPQSALDQNVTDQDLCLIVADYFIPGFNIGDWLPLLREKYRNTPIVIISSSISRIDRAKCFEHGADAYYEKHSEPEDVLTALQKILNNHGKPKDTNLARPLANQSNNLTQKLTHSDLTKRQVDVLIYLTRGHSIKSIAAEFNLSTETIKSHTSQIYRKLGVSNREGACRWARDNGLI